MKTKDQLISATVEKCHFSECISVALVQLCQNTVCQTLLDVLHN